LKRNLWRKGGGEGVVMNRQKHFEVDPFLCFRKGNVVRKSCEESAESETRGQFS